MFGKLSFAMLAAAGLFIGPVARADTTKPKTPDPNERICEKIKPVGSRLATKKVCATRAEWEDYRRQDRDALDKAQRLGCLSQGKCGGT